MFDIMLAILFIPIFLWTIRVVIRKRKAHGVTGIKSALTPICFLSVGVLNILALLFDFIGLISWGLSVAFLLIGAYFTKYQMPEEDEAEGHY
ncbi:hypothetical protein Q0N12_20965 [Rossellomorea marisflavi]|uniref:hypothetical protein n=1 Tax=Rossellomorea marisflavi TaxID=189381 RepID=UPI0034577680